MMSEIGIGRDSDRSRIIINDLNDDERERKVTEGLRLITKHLDNSAPVWTSGRWISFSRVIEGEGNKVEQVFRLVHSEQEAMHYIKAARFLDCRIRAYHSIDDTYTNIAPSVLLVDIDKECFDTVEEFKQAIEKTRANFRSFLGVQPTELWTGNGVHFILTQSAILIEEIKMFKEFKNVSRDFIRFEEQFLSNGKADPKHSNNISFGNCMLRIPGSLNANPDNNLVKFDEKGQIMEILPEAEVSIMKYWDGNRPSIKPLMPRYYIWLQAAVARHLDKQMESGLSRRKDWRSQSDRKKQYQWIENLLNKPIHDHRKYCIWRVLVPYLINVRGLSMEEAFNIIRAWLVKCSYVKRLNFPIQKVDEALNGVGEYFPIARLKLEDDNKPLFELLRNEGVIY